MMRLTSVYKDNKTAMSAIEKLYFESGAVVRDVTYGKGVFWRCIDTSKYNFLGTDLLTTLVRMDFNKIDFEKSSVDVLVFDPPYRYSPAKGKTRAGMENNYKIKSTAPKNVQGVIKMYGDFIDNADCLRPGGILIIKCQDTIQDGNQHWVHVKLINYLEESGYVVEDLAIVISNSKNVRWLQQYHLDKVHSYFIVARSGKAYSPSNEKEESEKQ